MNKFIGAVILLFLTLAAVLFNSAYMNNLCDDMTELTALAILSEEAKDHDAAQGYLTELINLTEHNKVYLGIICDKGAIADLNAEINEANMLFRTQEYADIPVVLQAVSLNIHGLCKYEFISAVTLF